MDVNDKLLKQFFNENKQEIANNGFSNRVLHKLHETADRSWIVWIFAAMGMSLTLAMGIYSGFFHELLLSIEHISIYYLLAVVVSFPVLGAAMYFSQNKIYRLI